MTEDPTSGLLLTISPESETIKSLEQQAAAMQAADDAQRALDAASTPPGSVVCVASVGDGPAPNVTFDRVTFARARSPADLGGDFEARTVKRPPIPTAYLS